MTAGLVLTIGKPAVIDRRYNNSLIVTGHAIRRGLSLRVTLHAKTHRMIDNPLGHCHLRKVSVTRGALNFGANMGGVIETNVGLLNPSVNSLPRNVLTLFLIFEN